MLIIIHLKIFEIALVKQAILQILAGYPRIQLNFDTIITLEIASYSNPLITLLVPLATSPHSQVLSKSHLINVAKDTCITFNTLEISVVWGAMSLELWAKTK